MDNPKFGELKRKSLRDIWPLEENFSQWLAQDDNLAALSRAIGENFRMGSAELEKTVGSFSADIVCQDHLDSPVVIENQFGSTDHDHLGKLLTYATGEDAAIIIWIAEKIRDGHCTALNWLNEKTGDAIKFFGVEMQILYIGESLPVPEFKVRAHPERWSEPPPGRTRADKSKTDADEMTPLRQNYFDYWTAFNLHADGDPLFSWQPEQTRPSSENSFPLGRSGFCTVTRISGQKQYISVIVALFAQNARPYFDLLEKNRAAIEREIGEQLDWRREAGKKQSRIELRMPDADPTNKEDWPRQHAWLLEKIRKINEVFRPYVRALNLSNIDHGDEGEDNET